jgi:hypothetical protein
MMPTNNVQFTLRATVVLGDKFVAAFFQQAPGVFFAFGSELFQI